MIYLDIQKRDPNLKTGDLRRQGLMPAVFYGRTEPSTPIAVPLIQFEKVWRQAGESTVVTLKGLSPQLDALIADVDLDPVSYKPRHADFYVFEEGRKVEVAVPLEFVGVSPAVKEKGGMLVKVLHELKVEAEPRRLPGTIEVDISCLKEINDHLTAGDLPLPEKVELIEEPEETVVSVFEPEEELEVETQEEVDFSNIEVEKKGKTEETETESAD